MKTIRFSIIPEHGLRPFYVSGVRAGKLFAHDRWLPGCRVAHIKTTFALPGRFPSLRNAVAAAREMDRLCDWDKAAVFINGNPDSHATALLYSALRKIAVRHRGDVWPKELQGLNGRVVVDELETLTSLGMVP